ncbi:putative amidoligase enzyme-domain-containing protein [Diaporthe sp. PMI_573]|nr:putative amidoligase enzyme-domain-containing protein [Diaporthaceae sp. PMI_573]
MTFRASAEWRDEISGLFNGLNGFCAFQGNQSCGFHVHISPYGQYWSLPELKGICRAIIHFERAIAALLPPHRNGSFWAKTHSNNVKKFVGKTVADCIKLIQACKSIEELVMLMNEGNRYFAWNFMNLDQDHLKTGTIEWRQPAAMTSERGCIAWVELAIAFVLAGRRSDVDCTRYPGTVEGLKEFTSNGLVDGASDVRYLNAIFSNKTGAAALVAPNRPTNAELETKVKEDQKKNLMLRKLEERLAAEAAARKAAAAAAAAGNGNGGRK